jgi:hypothetical protein
MLRLRVEQTSASAAVVTALLAVLSLAACDRRPTAAPAPSQPHLFHGKVIDQSGNPVQGAEIVVQVSEMQPNPIIAGGLIPNRLPKNHFSVYSGVTGNFLVTLPPPNHVVEIQAVKKEGYDWVFDWAWSLGTPSHGDGDNRLFILPGRFTPLASYQPDPNRPAVFPLHRKGDPSPATHPSRGGSDRNPEGVIVPNSPTPLRIPSAGPGAPTTNDAINARIAEYVNAFHAAQRTQPR